MERTTSPITKYGSLLSVDIDAPTPGTPAVTPAIGSFAVTGVANANAAWTEADLGVAITYNIKASNGLNITNPTVAPVTFSKGGTDDTADITIPSIGETTVLGMALHDDDPDSYGDPGWNGEDYTIDYTTTPGSAIIKIPKTDGAIAFLGEAPYKGQPQELVIPLSNGQVVVTTLTVTD